MKHVIFGLILSLSVGSVFAATGYPPSNPQPIKMRQSAPGQSMDEFAKSIAPFLKYWTDENNAEMCGIITQKEDVYYVILMSNYSQISCHANSTVTGTSLTGMNIHSHPKSDATKHITVTDATREAEPSLDPQVARIFVDTRTFSQTDYANGPGYLVAQNRLLFQYGLGSVRVLEDTIQ